MPNTYTNLLFHVVYSTKCRKQLIGDDLKDALYGYIGGIIRDERGILLSAGGMPDHVHLVARFSPTIALATMLRLIKTNSSKWINEHGNVRARFEWQSGYGAFSVSESQLDRVRSYVRNQQEHHAHQTFREEYLDLLRRHNIEFDERYVFDEERIA